MICKHTKQCPKGHFEIDYVNLHANNKYVYCYICQKKYYEEDYE